MKIDLTSDYGGVARFCLSKRRYRSKAQAEAACTAMQAYHKQKFKPYRCPTCGNYHVSHKRSTQ